MEFYTLPHVRSRALPMFRELLTASQATHIEAQTNSLLMLLMLYDCAKNITAESILFHDAFVTHLACPNGVFRRATPEDTGAIFPHQQEPVGDWVVEAQGTVVATGGFLCHYNPPYGDIFMEVTEPARRQGFGSYLVQEVKRVCYEAGKKPAARCHPDNVASRRTLQKAGFLPCGRLLVGEVGALA
jgi:GNAT superfamily N-acetyltransferase